MPCVIPKSSIDDWPRIFSVYESKIIIIKIKEKYRKGKKVREGGGGEKYKDVQRKQIRTWLGADLGGALLTRVRPFLISCHDFLLGYKTQALNMLTTKKINDHFQKDSEQTAKKRKSRRISSSKYIGNDCSIKILPLKRHIVAWSCKKFCDLYFPQILDPTLVILLNVVTVKEKSQLLPDQVQRTIKWRVESTLC